MRKMFAQIAPGGLAAGVLLFLAVMGSNVSAGRLPPRMLAASSSSPELATGLRAYLQSSPQYSDFFQITENLTANAELYGGEDLTSSKTLLLPNNTVLRAGFAQLAQNAKIADPDTFLQRLIPIGNPNYQPPAPPGDPGYNAGTEIHASNQEAAGIVLYGFAYRHLLPDAAYDFYGNSTITGASYASPVNVSTSIGSDFEPFDVNLFAYGASNAPGPETVYLRDPEGLLNVNTGVALPRSYLQAVNGSSTLNVYDFDGVFDFSGDFLPADVGVDCTLHVDCGSVQGALAQLAAAGF